MLIYIDESGDLGKRGSTHFVMTAVVTDRLWERRIGHAIRRTLRVKVNRHKRVHKNELKGSGMNAQMRAYFWKHVCDVEFFVCSVVVDKKLVNKSHPTQTYLRTLSRLIDRLPLGLADGDVVVNIDRSHSGSHAEYLGRHLTSQLVTLVDADTAVFVNQLRSEESPGLQMADLLGWGIFRKYVAEDESWYRVYQGRIAAEELITVV